MKGDHEHEHDDCCSNDHGPKNKASSNESFIFKYWKSALSLFLLLSGLTLDYLIQPHWFAEFFRFYWYSIAYVPVAFPVLKQAFIHLKKGDVFTEFFLMGIATFGAFMIGEYPEGVAVMLFYSIGEAFQLHAVQKARANITSLLDVRSETAHVIRNDSSVTVHPGTVEIGEMIRVKPGERIPLDGKLLNNQNAFDTSALTGESKPRLFEKGDSVLAGMINLNQVIELEVVKTYENSSISKILEMVQYAASRKAKTELFIRSFAKVYTPIIVFLATLLVIIPSLFVTPYVFHDWLYRGLVFLVISCPCALVISIPLGYFGGIGAASRNGILVKGSNFLDVLKDVVTVVFDKTGTLTSGEFAVQEVHLFNNSDEDIRSYVLAVEKGSTHPIAKAIIEYFDGQYNSLPIVEQQQEISGEGIQAVVSGKQVLIGNNKLMEREKVSYNSQQVNETETKIHIAIDQEYKGSMIISDKIKEDSSDAVKKLQALGIKQIVMLSGDTIPAARHVGNKLNMDQVHAGLLPEEKVRKLQELKNTFPGLIAYAGDGINDAPVLALSDVGIAMGAMGSDAAIETSDVVIQTDQPSKIATAIQIARSTRNIVWQNIGMAMGVKILFLALGALGLATLWEAVFADVGVALLAILNAIRIQNMKFE
jgi:Zn2+/Cd2+-exporting ATPase